MAFTPRQERQLDRRTTPSSRQRLAGRFKQNTVGTAGQGKPGLSSDKFGGTTSAPAAGGKPRQKPTPRVVMKPGAKATPDSAYYDAVDLADRSGASRLGSLDAQERDIKHEFGIDDPTNPFSRMEGMKQAFLRRFRGTSAGLAAQGHLYSGQHERALARTRREEEEARAGLRSQFDRAIGQVGALRAGVKFDTEEQRLQAFENWLSRAPESEAITQNLVPGWGGGEVEQGKEVPLPQVTPSSTKENQAALDSLGGKPVPGRGQTKPPKVDQAKKALQDALRNRPKNNKKPATRGRGRGR